VSQPGRPAVVLDCVVFFQAAARPSGPAARIFIEFIEAGNLTLNVSDAILAEVRDVSGRPSLQSIAAYCSFGELPDAASPCSEAIRNRAF